MYRNALCAYEPYIYKIRILWNITLLIWIWIVYFCLNIAFVLIELIHYAFFHFNYFALDLQKKCLPLWKYNLEFTIIIQDGEWRTQAYVPGGSNNTHFCGVLIADRDHSIRQSNEFSSHTSHRCDFRQKERKFHFWREEEREASHWGNFDS